MNNDFENKLKMLQAANPEFTLLAISGGTWASSPVSERPQVILTDWQVFEVQLPGVPTRKRHFAGYNVTDREGRASSAIVNFDANTGRGVTVSRRVYELRGRPMFEKDGEYVWNQWKRINGVADVVEVTAEINALMQT